MKAMSLGVAALLVAGPLAAQVVTSDASARLYTLVPAEVADRVLGRIGEARALGVPAAVLTDRALELLAKGGSPGDLERYIVQQAGVFAAARNALVQEGRMHPSDGEIEAAALALDVGVDGAMVSELARSAPAGQSLMVPLVALSGLVDRGLPADQALRTVRAQLPVRAADRTRAVPPPALSAALRDPFAPPYRISIPPPHRGRGVPPATPRPAFSPVFPLPLP